MVIVVGVIDVVLTVDGALTVIGVLIVVGVLTVVVDVAPIKNGTVLIPAAAPVAILVGSAEYDVEGTENNELNLPLPNFKLENAELPPPLTDVEPPPVAGAIPPPPPPGLNPGKN